MVGFEVFAGAGGMSTGASMAGVNVKLAVDIDKDATETFRYNHPEALVINSDIRAINKEYIPVKKNEQLVLFGGPPCQGFSKSNHKTRNKENPNNWLYKEFIRLTKIYRPDWIVIENVRGMVETERGLFLEMILNNLEKAGYVVRYKILNALNFGVPQNRERLFIIGSLHNENYIFPERIKSNNVTVKQALSDLPSLKNGNPDVEMPYKPVNGSNYAKKLRNGNKVAINNAVSLNTPEVIKRYQYIPQGGNWKDIPPRLMKSYSDSSRCHTGIYHRLDENSPSVVIGNYRKNMLIHPVEDRGLSVREAARLQSFPDSYKFLGYLGSQQQQVGNAVPPLLSKAVFDSIINS